MRKNTLKEVRLGMKKHPRKMILFALAHFKGMQEKTLSPIQFGQIVSQKGSSD